jgi:hypothetical protein
MHLQCLDRCVALPYHSAACFISCEKYRNLCYRGC